MKRRLKAYGYEFDNPVKTEACLVLSPSSLKQLCYGRDNCFLIGEAAGFISPSSLEGISKPLKVPISSENCLTVKSRYR